MPSLSPIQVLYSANFLHPSTLSLSSFLGFRAFAVRGLSETVSQILYKMSDKREKDGKIDDEIDFSWGKMRGKGGANKEYQFYESFRFDGVEYSLYDCVYLFKGDEFEPYVGKLLKIWEHSENGRKVKVLWFFRPSEISNHLEGVNVLENELFLATGVGDGLSNINPLEAIAGKCNVVCISKDDRNRQPSVEELEMADYVFYRTFDVQNLTISDKLDEKIAVVDAELLLNKNNPQPADLAKVDGVNLAVGVVKPLISGKDTIVKDRLVDGHTTVAPSVVKEHLQKCHPSEKLGSAVETTIISNKDIQDVDGDVKCDTGLGSLLVNEEKHLKEKGDAAKLDNSSVIPSTSKCVKGSGQKITLKSPDSKQTELNKVRKGALTVTAAENGKSEPVNDVKKRNVAAEKAKSEDRPSNKLKLDGSAQKSIASAGTGTQKFVDVPPARNKVSQSAGSASEINDGGKLTGESTGISETPLGKQKLNGVAADKSSDKPDKVSVSKAPQRPGEAAKSSDRVKLSRERDDTCKSIPKKRKTNSSTEDQSSKKLGKVSIKQPKDEEIEACTQVKEVTQRPLDRSKWFTASPWEDRMKDAYDQGRLVLLQNLDPTYSSNEVENIIWHGLNESCIVKIVQHTATSSPHAGQAFAIFKTQEVAQKVIRKLERDCLMLPNGRPLVGTIDIMSLPGKHSQYFGHLVIDKLKLQMQKDAREAVSTSHSSQANTLEYEMALEWRLLQDRSDLCWKRLYQNQGEEMRKLKARLKSK